MEDRVDISISADTEPFEIALERLKNLSAGFGAQLTSALKSAAVSGKSLDDVLRRLGMSLAGMALERGLAPLKSVGSSILDGLLGAITGYAKGGVPGRVIPFASGGVVSSPTFFPAGGNIGLMGEAGAEAILPLRRGSDGRLGVAGGGVGGTVNVTFNVQTPDAASFRKSEAQVTAMLARAAARGARSF